jgi:CzcA family heavy metal efflux pump
MIRWIIGSSLKLRYLVITIAGALILFGIPQLSNVPLDVFPEFAPPRVEIQTPCLGLSTEEVEALVTVPLEQAMNGVAGLDVMRSKSVPDLSAIELLFKPGTDVMLARQLVQERLATVITTLPTWASPPFIMPPVSTTGRVLKIGVSSKASSQIDLSMISYWTIRARLLRVPGVANVAIWGERLRMPQVQVDPERMKQHDVTLDRIMTITADALDVGLLQFSSGALIGTGGSIDTPNQRLDVRNILPIVTSNDLAQVPIADKKKGDGTPLRLTDVAKVVEDHQPLIGDAVVSGGPGVLLVVEKYPWANTLQVTHGVEDALAALKPGLPGISIDSTIFRPADFIETAVGNLSNALLLGCILVALVLGGFLFEWRTAVISLVAIPLSLLAAAMVFYLQGATINTMILAGFVIAVGVVVDDAIIDVENIMRRLREARATHTLMQAQMQTQDQAGTDTDTTSTTSTTSTMSIASTASIILRASMEVRSAIIYATLIILLAVVPVFFIGGVSGAFFQPLALSYGLAVLASMLVALTVTPALCLLLLDKAKLERRESPVVRVLKRWYEGVLSLSMERPRWAYGVVGLLVVLGLVVSPFLTQSLFPQFKERDFLMHWVTKPGTSVIEERRIVEEASKKLMAIPGVRNFGSHIGQALLADEVVGVNAGENWISIDPSADYNKTHAAVQEVVDAQPGLYHDVLTYLNERIDEVLTGASETFVVRIYGPDLGGLRKAADNVKDALTGIDGIVDLHTELQTEVPQVQVEVDLAAAQRYGLKPGDVRRAAATLLSGEEVGDIFRDGKAYDVQVWSTPATRSSVNSIRDLLIDTPGGGHVRLGDVAQVRVAPAANVVRRENDSRRIDVGANVRGRDLGAVAADIQRRLQTVPFGLGYHAEVLGEYVERQAAEARLLGLAVAVAVGILLLLQLSFGSWRLAVLSFVTLPSALVGGVLAAFASGGVISLGSLVGFFTVFGIAARNGILLINHYQHLERVEGVPFGLSLVLRGARERLSPILMTALATGLALVPLVLAGDIPGHEIEHPMAVVILGGLFTSTLLNLFIVPAIYLRFGREREMRAIAVGAAVVPAEDATV